MDYNVIPTDAMEVIKDKDMDKEVFVIEKMVVIGVWELMSDIFYNDEKKAVDDCMEVILKMQKVDKKFAARVTKLNRVK